MSRKVAGCLVSLFCLSSAWGDFRAGVAVRVVTPDPLLPVSGGIGPSNPTHEKRGDLTVRALVLEQGGFRVAVVSGEFLGFPSPLGNKVRAGVTGIPPQNVLIGVTHTHSAPDCYGFPDGRGGFACDLKYLDFVCRQMTEAINSAVADLRPAKVKIGTGEARGKIAYNAYAPDLYDPRCSVIQVLDGGNRPFATLVNYAVHPEVLGDSRGILSPDLCGPLYARIAERGGGTAIFMNSAQGGMVTADNRDPEDPTGKRSINTWDECLRIGRLLADEALRIVADAPVQEDPKLFCAATTMEFPVDSPELRAILHASPVLSSIKLRDGKVGAQVNVVNLGNAQILTIPGEALPNIGFYLKRKMHGKHNLLFGLTNDAFGYIMTKVDWRSFRRYDYISRTCLGEMTGEILIEQAVQFVDRCPRPQG